VSSHRQILRVTALLGGTQLAVIALGVLRTKGLALLLGTQGLGLTGMYQSIAGLAGILAGAGLTQAGVRQIAAAAGAGDEVGVARAVGLLRWTSLVSGLVGTTALALLCWPLARLTFGRDGYATGLALVSLSIAFNTIAAGQSAALQGTRRVKDLAACQVWGGLAGTVLSLGAVLWLGTSGIPVFLVAVSAASAAAAWLLARRLELPRVRLQTRELVDGMRGLLGLGGAFLVSALLSAGAAYLTRLLLVRELGLSAVGLFTATWTLSSLYVGIVLNAMATDFYPRLAAVAADDAAVRRLTNEQSETGTLLAIPGLLATLVLAPWVLRLFYSADFAAGADLARWQMLGMTLRVVSWPLGFVLLAKGLAKLFVATEVAFWGLYVLALFVCVRGLGLNGAGLAFAVMYAGYALLMWAVGRRVCRFVWSSGAWHAVLAATGGSLAALAALWLVPAPFDTLLGLAVAAGATVFSVRRLRAILGGGGLWTALRHVPEAPE
jgi:enterobacterial common antigen flippase